MDDLTNLSMLTELGEPIVLSVRSEPNANMMSQVLSSQKLPCVRVCTVEATVDAIRAGADLVIVTEDMLATREAIDQLVACLNEQPEWSDIPVIFLLKDCRQFPNCLAFLRYIQHQRGITLLEMPLKKHEFISVVQLCLHNRQRQYALRDTLQQLQESNAALEGFSHTAAHELRNPLGVVTTSLDVLARSTLSAQQEKLVEMGLRTAKKMNRTLGTLLEYGKLNAAERVEFGPVDLERVVEQAVQGLRDVVDASQAELDCSGLPRVWGNEELLTRLVSNLIKNAIVHNDADIPVVVISANVLADRYRVSVTDNGPGVAIADQQRIFAMFTRGQRKRRKDSGSGIGLALCRRIVEQHRGTIDVQSELGKGSTFYFDLPKGAEE